MFFISSLSHSGRQVAHNWKMRQAAFLIRTQSHRIVFGDDPELTDVPAGLKRSSTRFR
jgi:hypothetical protein